VLFRSLLHPAYSPDLSACDFWLFGMLKGILNDREFHSHDEIEESITMAWNDFTFDESRASFTIGRTDLDGPLRTGESTLLKKDGSVYLCLLSEGIGGGTGEFRYPLYKMILDCSRFAVVDKCPCNFL
jgi:hypothetical protein